MHAAKSDGQQRRDHPGMMVGIGLASQGSGVYPFCLFCHAACEEETGMLWLLKTRHREALLPCITSFSCLAGIRQSPASKLAE
jgi:hypothetical protein